MSNLGQCLRLLAVLTLLSVTRSSSGKGLISFSAKSLTFFINDDVGRGKKFPIIKAQINDGLPQPHYVLVSRKFSSHQFFKIDYDSGELTLLRDLKNERSIQSRQDGTKKLLIIVRACSKFQSKAICAEVKVIIIALPQNFGDKWIPKAIRNITSEKLTNHVPPKQKGNKMSVTPALLLRILRRTPIEAINITMLGAKQDMIIDFIRKKIVEKLGIHVSRNLNFDCLHVEKIFSLEGLKSFLNSSSCVAAKKEPTHCYHYEYRSYDGTCNNLYRTRWGSAGTKLERLLEPEYADPDQLYLPKGSPDEFFKSHLPSASQVSRDFILPQTRSKSSREPYSHAVMQWGQFIDHDMDLSPEAEGADRCREQACDSSLTYSVPPCFPIQPVDNSSKCISLSRSAAVCQSDPSDLQPREQINVLTAFIDGSQIYGSSERQVKDLRTWKDGLLKMTNRNLLIQNHGEISHPVNLCIDMGGCFLSGDGRVNEQIGLASMHTLFNREHNRIAQGLKKINTRWSDEKLFQETRKIVGAIIQKITYEDFLPKILGKDALLPFQYYDSDVHPGIINEFSTAAFRFGHSMIRPFFDVLDSGYNPVQAPLPLKEIFFNNVFIQKNGIEPVLLGLLANVSQNVDPVLAVGLTKHLFERRNLPGLNLASLNIQRGRDHGLAGYNKYRKYCGLKSAETFHDLSLEITNTKYIEILKKLYKSPADVDLWVAGLAETPLPDAAVGPTFQCILKEQFKNLRDGDRFYYEEKDVFTREQLREIKKVTLSHIMCDNLKKIVSIQKDAFSSPTCKESRISCQRILQHSMNLDAWKEHTPCFSNPCLHGGHCMPINLGRNYQCFCPPYWTGSKCEFRRHPCNPSLCVKPHDMMCRSESRGTVFVCTCVPGMHGCKNEDYCKLNPCPTGYKCQKDGNVGYQCTSISID